MNMKIRDSLKRFLRLSHIDPEKGIQPILQDSDVQGFVGEVKAEFERRREDRRAFELQWKLNQNFYLGNQYCDIVAATGEVVDYPLSMEWEMRGVYNQIAPIVETRLSKLSRVHPGMTVRPATPDASDIAAARASTRILKSAFAAHNMLAIGMQATVWAEICGGVFYKSVWQPHAGKALGAIDGELVHEGDIGITIVPYYEIFPASSYVEELRIGLVRIKDNPEITDYAKSTIDNFAALGSKIETASLSEFMQVYQVNLMNPKVLLGMFVGSMMSFLFCGLTMNAVGRAANQMVNEVRRQFRENSGIMEGKADPDYARCVSISTKAAQKEMLFPALLAVAAPVLMGLIFGVTGVLGLLGGALASGFVLAVFMANSGGAWDNAKKYIEQGNFGGKGSDAHKAAVIGDTVGDPFKDTSGPSLNILIKLMSMVAIVMAGLTVSYSIL